MYQISCGRGTVYFLYCTTCPTFPQKLSDTCNVSEKRNDEIEPLFSGVYFYWWEDWELLSSSTQVVGSTFLFTAEGSNANVWCRKAMKHEEENRKVKQESCAAVEQSFC